MDFYNPQQLSEIYGGWNPETYMLGRAQVESSNQSQASARSLEAERAKQAGLETLFQEQDNPTRIRQGEANLQGTLYDNMSKGVTGRLAEATEPFKLDDAKRAQALAMPEHEIKMMQAKGQQWAYSDDPAQAAKGRAILQKSQAAIEARQKHADEMEKQEMIRRSAEKIAAGNNATTLGAAHINADSRVAAKTAGAKNFAGNIEAALLKQKIAEQYATLNQAALVAAQNGEEALAETYRARAAAIQPQVQAAMASAGVNDTTLEGGRLVNTPRGSNVPNIAPPGSPPGAVAPVVQAQPKPGTPPVGTVSKGHEFLGGDPANPKSWRKL